MGTPRYEDAVSSLAPKAGFSFRDEVIEEWDINGTNISQPTEDEIRVRLAELIAAEPMRLLRVERNSRLDDSDWWASSDLVMSNERQIYRQQLRDMPAFATPTLDDSGQLSGVTWPARPE